ncbi:MAG: hypothetical protein C4297_03135 [Gemmataceae bacterium]|mgnify:CR=1 FL=1
MPGAHKNEGKACSVILWVLAAPLVASASDLQILPGDIALVGPRDSCRVLAVEAIEGRVVAQCQKVRWTVEPPGIVRLQESVLYPLADGEAVLRAEHQGRTAQARVRVSGVAREMRVSFRNDVLPVLTRAGCNSGACHGALAGKGGMKLSLRGYDPESDYFVLTRQAGSRRVNVEEPSASLLLQKPTLVVSHGGGLRLDVQSGDFALLADWIAEGATSPAPDDPQVTGIEILPAALKVSPGTQVSLLVLARYSDGRVRDVTRWSKFASVEESVAVVNEEGQVQVRGNGQGAITAWFANHVAVARVISPMPGPVADSVYAQSARYNYIDDLVLAQLRDLHIPPSSLCTDREFIRRVYLDAAGILPTPEEVQAFVADQRPDKRARLIAQLLERSEFVDYWTYKWCDLFLVSTRRLPQAAVWSFYQYLRQSVAANKPWDRLAREILTVQGSNLEQGAANYFALHKDIADLTEATCVTFLGMSLTCARCHNHPLEKWTQDQYWSLANLFARVRFKNGDRFGEVIVQVQPSGDVLHPRRNTAMPPRPLDGEPAPDHIGDRREHFVRWLTAPDNPYFARAIVNRIWRHYLGRGLIEPEDDLRATNPPTHPELLAALTQDFVAHGYDVKHLMRTIMNSATYQRSAVPKAGNETDDRFYSRYLIRRLPAEVILDAYSQVTGVPTAFKQIHVGTTGGIAETKLYPLGTRALQLPDSLLVSQFLDAFGRPHREQVCSCERQQDASVSQALHLHNGQTLNEKLRDPNSRVSAWLKEGIGAEEAIRRLFLLALARQPTDQEVAQLKKLMEQSDLKTEPGRREAFEDLFWAVLTSNEFLFNH